MEKCSNYEKQVHYAESLFLKYDQLGMVKKYHLKVDEGYLYMKYLKQNYRINRQSGILEEEGIDGEYTLFKEFQTVMAIYDMLCFSDFDKPFVLSGLWQPVSAFQITGASPSADKFHFEYAISWKGKTNGLKTACQNMGGILENKLAGADITCRFEIFDFFPVLFQFWDGDDEFAPRIKILWDANAMEVLHFETMYYIMGDLLARINREFRENDKKSGSLS